MYPDRTTTLIQMTWTQYDENWQLKGLENIALITPSRPTDSILLTDKWRVRVYFNGEPKPGTKLYYRQKDTSSGLYFPMSFTAERVDIYQIGDDDLPIGDNRKYTMMYVYGSLTIAHEIPGTEEIIREGQERQCLITERAGYTDRTETKGNATYMSPSEYTDASGDWNFIYEFEE